MDSRYEAIGLGSIAILTCTGGVRTFGALIGGRLLERLLFAGLSLRRLFCTHSGGVVLTDGSRSRPAAAGQLGRQHCWRPTAIVAKPAVC